MKADRDYLLDLLEYIAHLEAFAAEGRDNFYRDIKTQLAVERVYEIIGEVVKRLPDDLLAQQPGVRWKDIKGFRDVLIHRYDETDPDRVWRALEDLPNLRAAVEAMLAALPGGEEDDA